MQNTTLEVQRELERIRNENAMLVKDNDKLKRGVTEHGEERQGIFSELEMLRGEN